MLNVMRLWLSRNSLLAALCAGLVAMVLAWDGRRLDGVRKDEQAKQLERGVTLNAKGIAAHERADQPGAADRLRAKYCRDC